MTEHFPRGTWSLADQLNRAACSIPANIAEGNGRWHAKDRTQFFLIARGSAFECVPLIDIAYKKGLVREQERHELRARLDSIGAMLSGLMKRNVDS